LNQLTYQSLIKAIKTRKNFLYTIEFYPREGKYHLDGHRSCQVRLTPEQTRKAKGVCPQCNRALTVGVLHRVEDLADRPADFRPPLAVDYKSLIPLPEIIAEIEGVKSATSKTVQKRCQQLISRGESEFHILLDLSEEELTELGGKKLAQAVVKMRQGEVYKEAGYDGVYGKIKIFSRPQLDSSKEKTEKNSPQNRLF